MSGVIKRKRKRYGIDSCPSFFPLVPESPPSEIVTTTDEPAPAPASPTGPLTPVMTVDTFLKRVAVAKPSRKYGKKRKRPVRDLDELPEEREQSQTRLLRPRKRPNHILSSPAAAAVPPMKRRPRPSRPFSQRLLEAALICQGDPIESLYQEKDILSRRKPLRFDVVAPKSKQQTRRNSWKLVDPKKATPFNIASFAPRSHTGIKSVTADDDKPITKKRRTLSSMARVWPENLATNVPSRPKATSKKRSRSILPAPQPLQFVPVVVQPRFIGTRDRVSSSRTNIPHEPVPLSFAPPLDQSVDPISLPTHSLPDNPPLSADVLVPETPVWTAPKLPIQPIIQPSVRPRRPVKLKRATLSDAEPVILVPDTDDVAPSPALVASKPLKPIASFFDQFLETIRTATATQIAASQQQRLSSHTSKRPKSSRAEISPILGLTASTTPSLRAFFDARKTSCTSVSPISPWQTDVSPSVRITQSSHLSSLDLVSALRPQSTQVVLGSAWDPAKVAEEYDE
ncbi:hypothetical protein C8J56DRAFT_1023969 [Mycena floridula]|nr:hypothetical protein C8J56DRAFT_1023969 [Mycena floridula]